jgi:hypothetical protein
VSYAARRIGEVPALAALRAVAGALAGCPSSAPSAFTSQNYGYSGALPAGWSSHQAGYKWPGLLSPSFEDSDVNLITGPNGIVVMGYGTATPHSVSAYTKATVQAAPAHQCPAVPASDQAITVGGAPARLPSMRCQGLPIDTAITQFMQEAVVFASQIPSGTRADRAAFRRFLADIRIQRRRLTTDDHAMPRHHATKQAALDRKKPASPARATGPQPSPRPHPQAPGPHAGSSETRRIGQYACLPPCVRRDRHP